MGHSIKKNYKNTPIKEMYYKNTPALKRNVVSNIKQSVKNFQRFKILCLPRDSLCLCIFNIIKNTPTYEWNVLQKSKINR